MAKPVAKKKGKVTGPVRELNLSLVGMQYRLTPSVRKFLVGHLPFRVKAEREPDNHQDPYAIAIFVDDDAVPYNGMKLGYLRRQVAAVWSPEIDKGRFEIRKGYLAEVDAAEGLGELLLTVKGNTKLMDVGP